MAIKPSLAPYSNPTSIRLILGAIITDPSLIKELNLNVEDFPKGLHQVIFSAVYNLHNQGVEKIDAAEIEEYLSHYSVQYALYKDSGGKNVLESYKEIGDPSNLVYHTEQLKKFSLLRRYVERGIDVSYYFDPAAIDPKEREEKRKRLDNSSVTQIINHFKEVQVEVAAPFKQQASQDSKKAGEGGLDLLEQWKKSIAWGIGYSSAYLTTALHGMRPKMLTVKSAGTGVGKTRTALADIAYACSPWYWDPKTEQWVRNLNGNWEGKPGELVNGALYIGTEMELAEEIDPILWAYVSNVPQDHIKYNSYRHGEEERVRHAIRLLENEANIHLAYVPDFTIAALENIIEEYVYKHDVQYVFFDYIHTTTDLIAEFQKRAQAKIAVREDQVLLDLSTHLKQLARDLDICINTATQVNGNFRDVRVRDQTLIAGSKAVVNKADNAMIAMPPTKEEIAMVQPIIERLRQDNDERRRLDPNMLPNLVYSVYKVRDSRWKGIKIWLNVDYSTMRTHDMFVTDYNYEYIPDIEKMYINILSREVATAQKAFGYTHTDENEVITLDPVASAPLPDLPEAAPEEHEEFEIEDIEWGDATLDQVLEKEEEGEELPEPDFLKESAVYDDILW